MSPTVVQSDLSILEQSTPFIGLLTARDLSTTYTKEFISMRPKLRKIKDIEVYEIVEKILEKVDNGIIVSAKEFRKIAKIFLRAKLNEESIHQFLQNIDMSVFELESLSIQSRI